MSFFFLALIFRYEETLYYKRSFTVRKYDKEQKTAIKFIFQQAADVFYSASYRQIQAEKA